MTADDLVDIFRRVLESDDITTESEFFALGTFVKGAFKDTCDSFKSSGAVNATGPAESDCSK